MMAGAVVAFCTAAGAAEEAAGAQHEASGVQKGACKADAEKLCKDVQPGEGKLLECLKAHQTEVSSACKHNLAAVKQAAKQVSAACQPDIEQFCMNTPVGKGGIAKCLKQHSGELSADCKGAVSKAKARSAPKQ
jgi:hypothetical protein